MKKIFLLALVAFYTQQNLQAQWVSDTALTHATYANDVYYKMSNGARHTVANNSWHIAFQMIPQGGPSSSVGVIANHGVNGVMVYSLGYSATAKFNSLSAADTIGRLNKPLYNSTQAWGDGALNRNRNASNVFDYGWGKYSTVSHDVEGDSLYLIKVGTGANTQTYKLTVSYYNSAPVDSIYYTFRVAKFDGTADTTYKVYRINGFVNRAFAFFNLDTRTFADRESTALGNWDLLFTKYTDLVTQGPTTAMYPVTGVLSAPGVKIAEERMAPQSTASYTNQVLSTDINQIGHDWKNFEMTTNTWKLDTMATYFVKTSDAIPHLYQLYFTHFGGSATGLYRFNKKDLGMVTGIQDVTSNLASVNVVPNPANGNFHLIVDAKQTVQNVRVAIVDMMGRVVKQHLISLKAGLNAIRFDEKLSTGSYSINLVSDKGSITTRVIITE